MANGNLSPDRFTDTVEPRVVENLDRQFALQGQFSWNPVTKHYNYGTGLKETARSREVRASLQLITRSRVDMQQASVALRRGLITLEEWQLQMARAIKNIHISQLGLARGGMFNMTDADLARAAEQIKFQMERLVGFAEGIQNGKVNLFQRRFLTRTNMYADAGKTTYWQGVRQNSQELGMTQERNVLGLVEKHCQGCLDETAKGWVNIGELKPVGNRICLTNCYCNVIFKGPGGGKYE